MMMFQNSAMVSAIPFFFAFACATGIWMMMRERAVRSALRVPVRGRWLFFRYVIAFPAAIGFLCVAIADPVEVESDILKEKLHGKVLLIVDNSFSMQAGAAGDLPGDLVRALVRRGRLPTRLDACIETIQEAFRGVSGLEIALFTFAGSAQIRSDWMKLSSEHGVSARFDSLFRSTRPSWAGSGTDFARVFIEAHQTYGDEPDFVVLCSDGGKGGAPESSQDAMTVPDSVAYFGRSATEKKIPIYAVGVGGESLVESPIPLFAPDGRITGFARNRFGFVLRTAYAADMLELAAQKSGGSFVRARELDDVRAVLRGAVLASIRRGWIKVENARSAAAPFAAAAFVLLAVAFDGFQWLRAWIFVHDRV